MKAMMQLAQMRHISCDGELIDRGTLNRAQSLLRFLPQSVEWTAMPGPDGSVQLESHQDGFDIEITIRATSGHREP